eukprot:7087162-Prymnesium_polylepis.2
MGYGHWSGWAAQALGGTDSGSRMCQVWRSGACVQPAAPLPPPPLPPPLSPSAAPVSYTHLTLPTICSV